LCEPGTTRKGPLSVPHSSKWMRIASMRDLRSELETRIQREWSDGMEILFVGCDPIGRDVTLSRGQIDFTGTDHFMKAFFESVLDARIPSPRCIRLRS
jgi:hypothetical protein